MTEPLILLPPLLNGKIIRLHHLGQLVFFLYVKVNSLNLAAFILLKISLLDMWRCVSEERLAAVTKAPMSPWRINVCLTIFVIHCPSLTICLQQLSWIFHISQEVGKREILKSCVSEKQLLDCTGLQRQRRWRWWVWLRGHAVFPGILPQRRHSMKLGRCRRGEQKWFLSRKRYLAVLVEEP